MQQMLLMVMMMMMMRRMNDADGGCGHCADVEAVVVEVVCDGMLDGYCQLWHQHSLNYRFENFDSVSDCRHRRLRCVFCCCVFCLQYLVVRY